MAQVATLEELAVLGLKNIYDAEQQAVAAYPEMIEAATSEELKDAFQTHLQQTQGQVGRLEQIFQQMGQEPGGEKNQIAEGLFSAGKQIIDQTERGPVLDAGLIAAAQLAEHYEIGAYGTARTYAKQLGRDEVARLLEETLQEEELTDEKLTGIAETVVNQRASSLA